MTLSCHYTILQVPRSLTNRIGRVKTRASRTTGARGIDYFVSFRVIQQVTDNKEQTASSCTILKLSRYFLCLPLDEASWSLISNVGNINTILMQQFSKLFSNSKLYLTIYEQLESVSYILLFNISEYLKTFINIDHIHTIVYYT